MSRLLNSSSLHRISKIGVFLALVFGLAGSALAAGNVMVTTRADSSQWFYSMIVSNADIPVNNAEISWQGGSGWLSGNETMPGVWNFNNLGQPFIPPLSVRLTSSSNEMITANNAIFTFTAGEIYDLGAQFSPPPEPEPIDVPTMPWPALFLLGGLLLWQGRRLALSAIS